MTSVNATLLGGAMLFISLGVATVKTDWVQGVIEFAVGLLAIVVYEILPPSTPTQ